MALQVGAIVETAASSESPVRKSYWKRGSSRHGKAR